MRAASDRRIREHNDRMHLAHTTAHLTAYAPPKGREFIKVEKLYHQFKTNRSQQAPEQQLAIVRSWMANRRLRTQP